MKFDPTKPVRRRDLKPARVVCVDVGRNSEYRLLALVTEQREETPCFYNERGHYPSPSHPDYRDLVNIPEKRTGYLNIYSNDRGSMHPSLTGAEFSAGEDCIIVGHPIEYEVPAKD